jgi:AcrR family transcriptional regulator
MAHIEQPPEDLRVRRTRKLLKSALIELTIEKGFAAVTVHDIADRAMVNRATFYRHYLDKYDLLEQYMREVYDMTAAQEAIPVVGAQYADFSNPPAGLISLLEHIQQHADFYRVMLGKQGDVAFVQNIQQYIEKRFRSLLPASATLAKPRDALLELCLSYVAHAGVGAIVWWLNSGSAFSPQEVATWLNQLSKANLDLALNSGRDRD